MQSITNNTLRFENLTTALTCIYCWCVRTKVIFLDFYGCPKESHDSCLDCTCNKVKGGMIMHCVVVPKSCVCQYLSVFLNVSVSYLLTFLSKRCSQLIVIYECHLYALFYNIIHSEDFFRIFDKSEYKN